MRGSSGTFEEPEPLGAAFDDVEHAFQELERAERQRRCAHPEWLNITLKGDPMRRELCSSCGIEREVAR